MAKTEVTIKLDPMEHRLMVNELRIHADELKEQHKGMPAGKAKNDLLKRVAALEFLLEKI